VFKGRLEEDGTWKCTGIFNTANVWSDNGFIVLKLDPRVGSETYSIGQILPGGIGGRSYVVRRGTSVPVFHANPGAITFVGAIEVMSMQHGDASGFGIRKDENTTKEDAQRFISHAYPNLHGALNVESLKMVHAKGGC